ncbi:MAG: dihydroorotase [Marinobacterium sp.]|nr:dihydroorotase [Marinobacterium sp.]
MNVEDDAMQQADLIIKHGQLVTPSGIHSGEVVCKGGRIVALNARDWHANEVIDARGLHVLPGVIDSQVHFREPGLEHKETLEAGTRGAVLGGVTGVFEMPNTNPLTLDAADLNNKLQRMQGRAWCNYAFYMGGSADNVTQLPVLEQLPGCAGVKVFMGSSFGSLLADEDELLEQILRAGKRRMAVHAEDEQRLRQRKETICQSRNVEDHPEWRDVESALNATRRILRLAEKTGRRLHLLHITSAEEIALLAQHKSRVTVEVTPHHLTMAAPDCYQRLGSLAQMNPPVRSRRHQDALWQGIRDGVVDVIGSDHAPHTLEEKSRQWPDSPSGMTGVQTLLPVMLNHLNEGRLSLMRLVDLTSAGPARIFGLEAKGRIAVGYDADLTLVDLSAKRTISNDWIASVAGWSPYDGMEVTGWPMATVIGGECVMRDDELLGEPAGQPFRFLDAERELE